MSQSAIAPSGRAAAEPSPVVAPGPAPAPFATRSSRQIVAGGAGLAASAAVVALRLSGLLVGVTALTVAACLIVLVPTARTLSQRFAVSGALLAGAVPALWWILLPSPGLRATLLLALPTGGLTTYLTFTGRRGLGRLRPDVAPVDAVPLLAAVAGLWILRPWFTVRTAAGALQMLLQGWDFSAHLAMVLGDRSHGGTVDVWGAQQAGETWKFREYPQGFHTTVATLVELWQPHVGRAGDELLLATRGLGLVALLGTVLVVAALCGLPGLRQRPGWAAVAASAVVAALLLGPGATALAEGFPNFLYAAALAACVAVMAGWRDPATAGRVLVSLVALEVAAAQAWVLLAVAVAPVVVVHVVTLWLQIRRGTSHVPAWLLCTASLALAAGAGRALVQVLGTLSVAGTLVVDGGITMPDRREVVVLVVPTLALSVLALRGSGASERGRLVGLVERGAPLLAMAGLAAVTAAVGAVQIVHGTHLGYYFWKLVAATSILATPVAAVAVASLARPPARPRTSQDRVVSAMLLGACAVTASQFFGLTVGGTSLAPGMTARSLLAEAQRSPSATAAQLVASTMAAPTTAPGTRVAHTTFLAPVSDGASALGAQQWYLALTGSWTVQANDRAGVLNEPGTTAWPYGTRALDVLAADPAAGVLVAPSSLAPVRAMLDPIASTRTGTWPEQPSAPVAPAPAAR